MNPSWVTARTVCTCCVGTIFAGDLRERAIALLRDSPQLPSLAVWLFNALMTQVYHKLCGAPTSAQKTEEPEDGMRSQGLARSLSLLFAIAWIASGGYAARHVARCFSGTFDDSPAFSLAAWLAGGGFGAVRHKRACRSGSNSQRSARNALPFASDDAQSASWSSLCACRLPLWRRMDRMARRPCQRIDAHA